MEDIKCERYGSTFVGTHKTTHPFDSVGPWFVSLEPGGAQIRREIFQDGQPAGFQILDGDISRVVDEYKDMLTALQTGLVKLGKLERRIQEKFDLVIRFAGEFDSEPHGEVKT